MSGRILFVTGTDTGVGKTVVSAVLAREARENGTDVAYCKPVQTGLATGQAGGDADLVGAAAAVPVHELERFREPLAPAEAAAQEGRTIDGAAIAERVRGLAADVEVLIVEGAGGLLVPLTEQQTMADLAAALEAPLVVVARPGLGTLNHTALTYEAAERRGLAVEQIVLSGYPSEPGLTERTNLERLQRLGPPVRALGPTAGPWDALQSATSL